MSERPHAHEHAHETSCSVAHEHHAWRDFFTYNPVSRHRRRFLYGALDGLHFKSLLDVGCGDGRFLSEVGQRYGCELYGMDAFGAPPVLEGGVDLRRFYAMDIGGAQPQERFDVVVMSEVLEHASDWEAALRHACRCCSGNLLVTLPNGKISTTDALMGHFTHVPREKLASVLHSEGFRVTENRLWGWPWHSLYKSAQDWMPGAVMRFGKDRYSRGQRWTCNLLYWLFFLNFSGRGRQLFLFAQREAAVTGPGTSPAA